MKKDKKEEKIIIKVTESFGSQDLTEIYSDYVAKQIRDSIREINDKDNLKNST